MGTLALCLLASLATTSLASTPEEIRARRKFRSEPGVERLLAWPKVLLRTAWSPIRRALDYAERVDLPERAIDAFYFNSERTAGWLPEVAPSGSGRGAGLLLFHDKLLERSGRGRLAFTAASAQAAFAQARLERPWDTLAASADLVHERDDVIEAYARPSPAGTGLGFATSGEDRRSFSVSRWALRVDAGRKLEAGPAPGLFALAESARTSSVGPPAGLPGLGETRLLGGGARLAADRSNDRARPTRGARGWAEAELAASPGGRFGHARQAAVAEGFLPLWAPGRTVMARLRWERLSPLAGLEPPWHRYPVLDLQHGLRGYPLGRFRDLGTAAFTLEYRYPIWRFWDLFAFLDGGQAFGRASALASRRLSLSRGLGLRFLSEKGLILLLEASYGVPGPGFQLAFGRLL